jgi:hypothetical protein
MPDPIDLYIQDVTLVIATNNLSHHLRDWGHRLNPDFHKKLSSRRARDGSKLKFEDPAVKAFLGLIGVKPDADLTASYIRTIFHHEFNMIEYPDHHSQLPALKRLLALREDNGWAELDKLLTVSHGCSFSIFFDEIHIHRHPEDIGPVGEERYKICVEQGTYTNEGVYKEFFSEWFAVASSCDFALRLTEMIMAGDILPKRLVAYDRPLAITKIQIMKANTLVVDVVIDGTVPQPGSDAQTYPLVSHQESTKAHGDLSLIKAIAAHCPRLSVRSDKGRVLEESLGL